MPDYLVKRWESLAPNDRQRILWDIAVFEAVLRPELATLSEVVHDGSKLQVWTKIDVKGMQPTTGRRRLQPLFRRSRQHRNPLIKL